MCHGLMLLRRLSQEFSTTVELWYSYSMVEVEGAVGSKWRAVEKVDMVMMVADLLVVGWQGHSGIHGGERCGWNRLEQEHW